MSTDDRTPETPEVNNESTPEVESTEEATLESIQPKSNTPESIPYNRFKEVNDDLKTQKDLVAELTQKLEESSKPATQAEATKGLKELAAEHNLDLDVLGKIASEIKAEALAEVQQEIAPITEARKQAEADKVFDTMYKEALKANPQYEDVVDREVIKQLAFNPANANKTFSQLLNNVYGKVVNSSEPKKTMESTKKGKTEAIDKIDFKRAQTDSDYYKQVMSDPGLKAQYNEQNLKMIANQM